jgi:hypothetical protein
VEQAAAQLERQALGGVRTGGSAQRHRAAAA